MYTELKKCLASNILNNQGALVDSDDEKQTITLKPEKIKLINIKGVDMTQSDSRDHLEALFDMGKDNLSGLQNLDLGIKVHQIDGIAISNRNSGNNFTDPAKLALIPERFPELVSLDLSSLRINSLKEFANVRDDISIDFTMNKICDFTGVEGKMNFDLNRQDISISGDFAAGREIELPELVKRVLDENDVLKGSLDYENCSLSDDGTKLMIQPDVTTAYVTVQNGKLRDSKIRFLLKWIPSYTVPQNLTAVVGNTLADVPLPEKFTWKEPSLDVGTVGTHLFKAVYTPKDTDRYVIVDDIDIPVTVKGDVEEPVEPTPTIMPAQTVTPAPTPTVEPKPTAVPEPALTPAPTPVVVPTPSVDQTGPVQPAPPRELTEQEKKEQKKRELAFNAKLKVSQKGRKIEISWGKVPSADGYDVYVQYCSKDFDAGSITLVRNGKTTKLTVKKVNGKNLDLKKVFKVYVLAFRQEEGRKATLAKTITAHVVGSKNTKYTNVKAVKVKKSSYNLKKGGTAAIKAATVLVSRNKKKLSDEHAKEFRYATTNHKIAAVSKKGKIKAAGKGSCSIYVYARNGYAKRIKVKVK